MCWFFCLPKTFVLKGQVAKHRNEIDVRDTCLSFTMSQALANCKNSHPLTNLKKKDKCVFCCVLTILHNCESEYLAVQNEHDRQGTPAPVGCCASSCG